MGLGVFIHRSDSIYNDSPAEQYQFPGQYFERVRRCVGDWIVYYEPRKVPHTRGYFAIAKVQEISIDPSVPGMYLAFISPGTYLDFAHPVPFTQAGEVIERGLINAEGKISGRAQSAVRPLAVGDFNTIVSLGLGTSTLFLPRDVTDAPLKGFHEEQLVFQSDETRERTSIMTSRIVRDRVFRQVVLQAYDERCAVSGLKLINGGGRAEVTAAHIKPVEKNGPDIVSNGLALSGTAHWMFDRGLISLTDNLEILISRQVNDGAAVRAFINKDCRALAPQHARDRPHPHFLNWHREHCFKH